MLHMRIAIIADFPWSALEGGAHGRGGGQGCTWLPQLAEAFSHYPEFEIHWVSIARQGEPTTTVHAIGQTFHRLRGVKMSVDLALRNHPARWLLRKKIREIGPDLVHAWGTESIHPCALLDFQGPAILSMQGVLTEYARIGGLPDDWRWRRMISTEADFMAAADIVTAESRWGIDRVREVNPDANCRMVEYGVHPDFYELPWTPDPATPYLIYVGGSGRRKGLDVLLDALAHLPERRWELRLAGDAAIEKEVASRALSGVTCLGMLPWNDMRHQLQGAWAFTLPTRGDTSPNSVKEARVIGLPVVTSTHGGQAGYIKDGVNGRIVDPLDPMNLAAALADVMSSLDRAIALGRGQHVEDRAYLRPERTAEGFIHIYQEFS